jgi:hypothetical protein
MEWICGQTVNCMDLSCTMYTAALYMFDMMSYVCFHADAMVHFLRKTEI